jgi:hypothetical protein
LIFKGDSSHFHGKSQYLSNHLLSGGGAPKPGSIAALNQELDLNDEESASVSGDSNQH